MAAARLNCCELGPGDDVLVTGSYDKTVKIWDLKSHARTPIQTLSDFRDSVTW
jgi:mitogen-activated protein kinase organizer 1